MNTASINYRTGTYPVPIKLMPKLPQPHLLGQKIERYVASLADDRNHFKWAAISMLVQAVFITPITSVVILYTGNWFPLWFLTTASMYACFIPSLAGLNVKWIKALLLINGIVSLTIIIAAFIRLFFF